MSWSTDAASSESCRQRMHAGARLCDPYMPSRTHLEMSNLCVCMCACGCQWAPIAATCRDYIHMQPKHDHGICAIKPLVSWPEQLPGWRMSSSSICNQFHLGKCFTIVTQPPGTRQQGSTPPEQLQGAASGRAAADCRAKNKSCCRMARAKHYLRAESEGGKPSGESRLGFCAN